MIKTYKGGYTFEALQALAMKHKRVDVRDEALALVAPELLDEIADLRALEAKMGTLRAKLDEQESELRDARAAVVANASARVDADEALDKLHTALLEACDLAETWGDDDVAKRVAALRKVY